MLGYAVPIFLGAFLLFQVQPLIARHILPWFGGTPSVWTTCMLFFQVLLLLGYAYAHLIVSRLRPRAQAAVSLAVLAASLGLLVLLSRAWGVPIVPDASWKPPDADFPVWRIVKLLTVAVGLPYFILASTSPTLQAWFSRSFPAGTPYRLYMLSNIGSLLALVSYPFVVEPALALRAQASLWTWGYVLFVVAYGSCAVRVWRAGTTADVAAATADAPEAPAAMPAFRVRALWIALPALASALLLAVTNQMCQAVAVIPFLWVLPLSLYLLSFIICFDSERWYLRRLYVPALLILVPVAVAVLLDQEALGIRLQLTVYAVTLFVACMVCHGELVAIKPAPRHLTAFYLGISLGGAVGGLFVGLAAPLIFRELWEFPLSLLLCWVVGIGVLRGNRAVWPRCGRQISTALIAVSLSAPVLAVFLYHRIVGEKHAVSRNFYGVSWMREELPADPVRHKHTMIHGRIIHGYQFQAAGRRRTPCSYYGCGSGVNLAITSHPRRAGKSGAKGLRLGVVGLGAGGLAALANAGDAIRFYEINPDVQALAEDPACFTYLADCPAETSVVLGDGRISLERELAEQPQRFDVLALDAFSGDAVPAHLLTREAFEIYLGHLRDAEGIIAVNISNRALDLKPVVLGLAEEFGLTAVFISSRADGEATLAADWMLLSRSPSLARRPTIAAASSQPVVTKRVGLWTDDYHNLFQLMR